MSLADGEAVTLEQVNGEGDQPGDSKDDKQSGTVSDEEVEEDLEEATCQVQKEATY